MRATAHDVLMERVDEQGYVLEFCVVGVSQFRNDHPLEAELLSSESLRHRLVRQVRFLLPVAGSAYVLSPCFCCSHCRYLSTPNIEGFPRFISCYVS